MTQIKDLKPNPKNPRKISEKRLSMLRKSIDKFGDLSGFVYNRRTKQLISGHQRTKTIPPNSTIKIEVKHESPTLAMTVAEGYILVGTERFKYREVDADESWEVEALLAANQHGGTWDEDLLRLNFADFPNLDINMAGFEIQDLEMFDIKIDVPQVHVPSFFQKEAEEETDEQYIRNQKKESEEIDTERFPSDTKYEKKEPEPVPPVTDVNPFEHVQETTDIKNKRIVIIIACPDEEVKKNLREKIREQVESDGALFF